MPRNRGKGSGFEKKIASRYKRAGYFIERNKVKNGIEIDIIAKKKRQKKLVIETKAGKQVVTSSVIKRLAEVARSIKGKPVLVIGPRVSLTKPAKKEAKKRNIRIRKVYC